MPRIRFVSALAFAGASAVSLIAPAAHAQANAQRDAVLSSPYLAKARACVNDFAAAGKSAGLMTDQDGGTVLILDPAKKEKLGRILGSSFDCLDGAFGMPRKMVDRAPGTGKPGTKSWVWYANVSGLYIWCASDGDSTPDHVDNLGGQSERRNWYAITVQCSIGDKVLGWYVPS
jgi:hypothetical protein